MSSDQRAGVERVGYLCIQGYPKRICSGCTTACIEPVFMWPEVLWADLAVLQARGEDQSGPDAIRVSTHYPNGTVGPASQR